MFKTFTPSARHAFQVLTLAALASIQLQAQAQFEMPAATASPTSAANAVAPSGGVGQGSIPPAMGLVQAPVMPPRPDLGARCVGACTGAFSLSN
jgi:hypothetical protein